MDPVLQKQVMPIFHYSLNQCGFLMLGHSETIGSFADLFSLFDRKNKIYAKKAISPGALVDFARRDHGADGMDFHKPVRKAGEPDWGRFDLHKETDRVVLGRYAPAGVAVNENLDILQFRGDTSPYFAPMPGAASLSLLKMIREDLLMEVRTAVHEAKKKDANARRTNLQVKHNGQTKTVNLEVIPISSPLIKERFFLVLFEEATLSAAPPPGPVEHDTAGPDKPGSGARSKRRNLEKEIARLRQELEALQAYLRATTEDQEAASEELRAANEEILSSNEELQSTNEELETAKEELQSSNEELTTLNDELQSRNLELTQTAGELNNLLNTVEVPIVILGADRRIRRFTPSAAKLLNLIAADAGRPIGQIRSNLDLPDLDQMASGVIRTERPVEAEVRDQNGYWYLLRMRPYRIGNDEVEGLLISISDINDAKQLSSAIVGAMGESLLVLDSQLRVVSANRAFYQIFQVKHEETENRSLYELDQGQWNIPRLRELLERVVREKNEIINFEVEQEFPKIGRKTMLLNARELHQEGLGLQKVLLAI